jgi:hypothetical protein
MLPAAVENERQRTRHVPAVNVPLHGCVHAGQPNGVKVTADHASSPCRPAIIRTRRCSAAALVNAQLPIRDARLGDRSASGHRCQRGSADSRDSRGRSRGLPTANDPVVGSLVQHGVASRSA